MIRSFIGLPLPEHAVRGLQSLQTGLPIARAVEPENLHLTLAFLDNQPEAMLRSLAEDLGEIRFDPFEIRLSGISLLGGKQPGAIAVNADGGDTLDCTHCPYGRHRAGTPALQTSCHHLSTSETPRSERE